MLLHNKRVLFILISLLIVLPLFGCFQNSTNSGESESIEGQVPNEDTVSSPNEEETQIDLAEIKANEAGQIMILEWHVIGEKEGRWSRTYENFRRDLETLYAKGYRLVSLRDVVTNNIAVEAGYTPVVLTFDDGTEGHFRYIEKDGERIIDPNCAVGILKSFAEEHPDFGLEATFYINYYTPFGQKDSWQDKIKEIIDLGMDLGNHTVNHKKLNQLSQGEVAMEIGKMVQMVEEIVPGYKLDTLALPHGINPKDVSWAVNGEYEGISYHNKAILLVGAGPIKSPVVKGFNAAKLPRIQVFQEEFDKWLTYFDNNPDKRYISDGNPGTIAVPAEHAHLIDESKIGDKELIIYE